MENDGIDKRVYVGECAGSSLVVQPWKEEVDQYHKGLFKKKRGLEEDLRAMVGRFV